MSWQGPAGSGTGCHAAVDVNERDRSKGDVCRGEGREEESIERVLVVRGSVQ